MGRAQRGRRWRHRSTGVGGLGGSVGEGGPGGGRTPQCPPRARTRFAVFCVGSLCVSWSSSFYPAWPALCAGRSAHGRAGGSRRGQQRGLRVSFCSKRKMVLVGSVRGSFVFWLHTCSQKSHHHHTIPSPAPPPDGHAPPRQTPFRDLPRPPQTSPDLPRPSQTFPDLPRPSQTFPDLPRPSQTFPFHPRPPLPPQGGQRFEKG